MAWDCSNVLLVFSDAAGPTEQPPVPRRFMPCSSLPTGERPGCAGWLSPPPRLLDRQRAGGLVCAAPRWHTPRFSGGAGDREPALRDPHPRLRHSERGRRAGRRLYSSRRQLRAHAGDGAGDFVVEADARSGDRLARPRHMAGRRRRSLVAPHRPEATRRQDPSALQEKTMAEVLPFIYLQGMAKPPGAYRASTPGGPNCR